MRVTTDLTNLEVLTLEQAAAHGPHYRMRRRAQAVLGHSRGQSISRLAALFAVDADTVSRWLRRWRAQGVSGLREGARSGRPPHLDAAAQKN